MHMTLPLSRLAPTLMTGALLTASMAAQAAIGFVQGEASFLTRNMLPPGAELRIFLVDPSAQDNGLVELGVSRTALGSAPPFAWKVGFDRNLVKANRHYQVNAEIVVDGRAVMATHEPFNVVDIGRPRPVKLVLRGVATDAPKASAPASIAGTTWLLTDLPGAKPLAGGKKLEAQFTLKDGQMTGRDGCNAVFGGYELDGQALKFKQMGASMMMCMDIEGQDFAFRQALLNTTAWRMAGERLELLAGDQVLMRLSRSKAP